MLKHNGDQACINMPFIPIIKETSSGFYRLQTERLVGEAVATPHLVAKDNRRWTMNGGQARPLTANGIWLRLSRDMLKHNLHDFFDGLPTLEILPS